MEGEIIKDIDVSIVEEYIRISIQDKIKITLKETVKVKEVKMISIDSKQLDNINQKIEVMNIDEFNRTIIEKEDIIGTEDDISIDNKQDMVIRTDVEEVSNINIKSRAAKIIDKENASDVVEI